jgi:hypothetical protein
MNYPELKTASIVFMIVLLAWSLTWIVFAAIKLRKSNSEKIYWQTHIFWGVINTLIASYSLISTAQIDYFTSDRAVSLRNVVAINIFLDVFYIAFALILKKSENEIKKQIGRAVLVQGLFLLILDTVIVMTFLAVLG